MYAVQFHYNCVVLSRCCINIIYLSTCVYIIIYNSIYKSLFVTSSNDLLCI